MSTFLSAFICFLLVQPANAYILRTKTILDKTSKKHGEAIYSIQQEIIFRNESESQVILENWVVMNGDSLFLEAKGGGNHFNYVYKGRVRHNIDENGAELASAISKDFLEGLLHYRSYSSLGNALIQMKLLSPKALEPEPNWKSSKEIRHVPETSVRLGRTAGVVAYTFGTATPVDAASPLPGLWIEQDHFFLRKIRTPTLAEMTAEEYQEYPKKLWYPKLRTISWGANAVTVRTLRISVLGPKEEAVSRLNPAWLRTQKSEAVRTQVSNSSLAPVINEFYSRFR